MRTLITLLKQHRGVLSYLFFGVLTTLVNLLAYWLLYDLWGIHSDVSTVLAWILAVAFAFLTNKPFVFESHDWSRTVLLPELGSFLSCRIGTGLLELVLMHVTVEMLHFNGMLMKLLTNVIVVILNYVGSRLLVFRKKP